MNKIISFILTIVVANIVLAQKTGIRTATPQAIVDIRGVSNTAVLSGQNYAVLELNENAGSNQFMQLQRIGLPNSWQFQSLFNTNASLANFNVNYNNNNLFTMNGNGYFGIDTLPNLPVNVNSASSQPVIIDGPENAMLAISELGSIRGYIGNTQLGTGNRNIEMGTFTTNTNGSLHLVTGANPRLSIIPNGNVGIGTTTPNRMLTVFGGVNIDQVNGKDSAFEYSNMLMFGTTYVFNSSLVSGEGIGSQRSSGGNRQYGLDFYANKKRILNILNNGNIGVNVSSPTEKLHISKDLISKKVKFTNGYTFPTTVEGRSQIFFQNTNEQHLDISYPEMDSTKPIILIISIQDGWWNLSNHNIEFTYDFVETNKTHGRIYVRTASGILLGSPGFEDGVIVNWRAIQKE